MTDLVNYTEIDRIWIWYTNELNWGTNIVGLIIIVMEIVAKIFETKKIENEFFHPQICTPNNE